MKNKNLLALYLVVAALVIMIIGEFSIIIYHNVKENNKYKKYLARDIVKGTYTLGNPDADGVAYSLENEYVTKNGIGARVESIEKTDKKLIAKVTFKFENDITFNQSAFRYGFAIYDENKNVYEVFSRMYFNSKEKMDYRTLYTYKDLGIKNYKNKVYELMLSDGCQSGSVLVGDKEITINVDITAKDSFPESKKLYINVFDLGYIEAKFDENNKPQVTDFNLSNTEWQFEVDC